MNRPLCNPLLLTNRLRFLSAFGTILDNRNFGNSPRVGFNSQESDDEIYGDENYLDFAFRGYNPRLGRFFAVDPLSYKFPYWTPYQFAGNTPIEAKELEGLETWHTSTEGTNENQFNVDESGTGSNVGPLEPSYAQDLGYTAFGINEQVLNPVFNGADLDRVAQTSSENQSDDCLIHCRANASAALNDPEVLTFPWQNSKNESFLDIMVNKDKALKTDGFVMNFDEKEMEFTFNKDIPSTLKANAGGVEGVFFYSIGAASNYHTMTLAYDNRDGSDNFFILDQGTGWLKTKMDKVTASDVTRILTSVAGSGLNYYMNKPVPGWNMNTPVKVNVIQLAKPETKTILYTIGQ